MRTPTIALSALAALSLGAPQAGAGQAHVSFSAGVGPLFTGVSFGLHVASRAPGPAFAGLSLGFGWGGHYGSSAYGIYSDAWDGWDPGYRGHARSRWGSCWDPYGDPSWDPWWEWDCFALTPYRVGYRGPSWGWRNAWLRPAWVYWADPFVDPWGPYWAYDPWGWYWDGYWSGRSGWGWGGWYSPFTRVRTVYATGGRTGVVIGRGSPLVAAGVGYKERADGAAPRTAMRRPAGSAPASAPERGGVLAPSRRAGPPSAPGASPTRGADRSAPSAVPSRRPSEGGVSGAAPRRPSDRAVGRGNVGRSGADATPAAGVRRAPVSGGAESPRRPSAAAGPGAERSSRGVASPTRRPSEPVPSREPQASPRSAPGASAPRASAPRSAPSASAPRASAPRSAPSASAPRASAPRSAPSASAPRASAPKASAPSRSGGSSRPPARRPPGGGA